MFRLIAPTHAVGNRSSSFPYLSTTKRHQETWRERPLWRALDLTRPATTVTSSPQPLSSACRARPVHHVLLSGSPPSRNASRPWQSIPTTGCHFTPKKRGSPARMHALRPLLYPRARSMCSPRKGRLARFGSRLTWRKKCPNCRSSRPTFLSRWRSSKTRRCRWRCASRATCFSASCASSHAR